MDLDPAGVRRARARAQFLGDTPAPSPADVVHRLVGVQAQDTRAAALAIRARTRNVPASAVWDDALAITWTLRGTRHLHLREDIPWLLALFGPRYGRPTKRDADLGIAGAVGERAIAALRKALDADGPLTRGQVKELLAPLGVNPDGQAAIHVIRRAALAGILVVIPGDPGERYAALHLPRQPHPADPAAALADRYACGYGPATPADFAAWSGLGRRHVDSAPLPAGADATPLRLVGGFDNLLLGYRDRSAHLPPEHTQRVNAGGGLIKPLVVQDGRVVGTWTTRGRGGIDPFPGHQFDASAELDDVRRFLAG